MYSHYLPLSPSLHPPFSGGRGSSLVLSNESLPKCFLQLKIIDNQPSRSFSLSPSSPFLYTQYLTSHFPLPPLNG